MSEWEEVPCEKQLAPLLVSIAKPKDWSYLAQSSRATPLSGQEQGELQSNKSLGSECPTAWNALYMSSRDIFVGLPSFSTIGLMDFALAV
jgi:hypothetical protein